MTYDFDFLTDTQEANKEAVLLAKIRYNEQLAPFINSPFAQDKEARLRYASDHIERIIDECCESVPGSEKGIVGARLHQVIAKEVAVSQPETINPTENKGGNASPPAEFDKAEVNPEPEHYAQQDILDRDGILVEDIEDPDAQIEADTPLSEGETQYPLAKGGSAPILSYMKEGEHIDVHACFRCGKMTKQAAVCRVCEDELFRKTAIQGADSVRTQPSQPYGQLSPSLQPTGPAPMQPAANPNQQMKCDCCGFVGTAQQVQDHYQKMIAANDQMHMNMQPGGLQPGTVQASFQKIAFGFCQNPDCSLYGENTSKDYCPECGSSIEQYKEASKKGSKYQYIKKRGNGWVIIQKGTGKVLSHHDSYEKAVAAFKAMMHGKYGAKEEDQDFLAEEHNHDQEDQVEGDPVKNDNEESEDNDPSDRFDEIVQNIADRAAARRYSQAEEDELKQIADRYGLSSHDISNHIHIVAHFGDYIGFNGDIVNEDPSLEGYSSIDDSDLGGRVESHEALVPLQLAIKRTAEQLKMDEQTVYDRVQDSLGGGDLPNQYHASVDGQRDFYLPDKLIGSGKSEEEPEESEKSEEETGQSQ